MRLTKTGLYTTYLLLFVLLLSGTALFNGCKQKSETNSFTPTGDTIADGKKLVEQYCTKCHALVPADALNKDVWKFHTLPAMSHYLGLSTYSTVNYYKKTPDTTGISLQNWDIILAYYAKVAPDTLKSAQAPQPLINDWAGFGLKKPQDEKAIAYTTLAAFNPYDQKIYTSDEQKQVLYAWDKDLKKKEVAELPSAAVNVNFVKGENGSNTGIFSCIGQLSPVDFPNGRVVQFDLGKSGLIKPDLLATDLARPLQTVSGDLNKDGLTDWVVCAQGFKKGGVYLLTQKTDHSFVQSSITDRSGAVQAAIGDFNNDGWQDVMVLFGTGDEGLWLFLNDHNNGFTTRKLLSFPPVYESTSFQLADINHDSKPDLIYTCGYNYYDSRIFKPYHGLYIFTNQGDWKFKQSYFYPINGCTKAIAADFDKDGDLDIATIAFFADMKHKPAEEFIYFEQDKTMSFKPHAIPVSKYGRWMTLDIADVNSDGKPDIILGNYAKGFWLQNGFQGFWDQNLPFIVLENHNK